MPAFIFADNARSSLGQAIGPSVTTITLAAGGGQAFPIPAANQQFALTLNDLNTRALYEVCYCTARVGDVLTVVRGQEGTVAKQWNIGDYAWLGPTSGQMAAMVQIPHMTDAYFSPIFSNTTAQGWIQATNYISTASYVRANGGFLATGMDPYGQFRAIAGAYGVFLRNDGSTAYWMQTNTGDQNGSWNNYRPFAWNLANGQVTIDGSGQGSYFGGNLSTSQTITAGTLTSSGNVNAAGTFSGGYVSVTGNVWGAGWVGSNYIYSNGNINAAGTYTGGSVSVSGDIAGQNVRAAGSVNATSNVTASFMSSSGDINAGHDLNAARNINCLNGEFFGQTIHLSNPLGVMYVGWSGDFIAWHWNGSRLDGIVNNTYVGSLPSDARLKTVKGPYARGLAELVQLKPVRFTLKDNMRGVKAPDPMKPFIDTAKEHAGVIAQEAETFFPELFTRRTAMVNGEQRDDVRYTESLDYLMWAAINAIKELAANVVVLETEVRTLKEARNERPAKAR